MDRPVETDLNDVERIKIDRTFDRLKRMNYYDILNLPPQADKGQIKRAYYTVSKEYHPDRYFRRNLGAYKDKLEAIFDLITRAYNTLNDDGLRAAYDRSQIEASYSQRPMEYEVSLESLGTPAPRATPTPSPAPGVGAKPAAPSPAPAPAPAAPVFMDKLQQQLMGRLIKAKEYVKMGKEAIEKEQWAQATSHLQLALSFDANHAEAKSLLVIAQGKLGDIKADQFYQRGLQQESLGNPESARSYYKMAVDQKPKKGHFYFKLGTLQMESEAERRVGLENLKQAVAAEPRNLEYVLSLAHAYEVCGLLRNALREYEKALTLEKQNDVALRGVKRMKAALP